MITTSLSVKNKKARATLSLLSPENYIKERTIVRTQVRQKRTIYFSHLPVRYL
jgi:hypothetical protein